MFVILINLVLLTFSVVHAASDGDIYSKFHQHDYKIQFTRIDLDFYNKSIYQTYEVITFKYNRTQACTNMSFQYKVDLDHRQTNIITQAYKFLSNEYRIFPMRFLINQFKTMKNNVAGIQDSMRRCGNIISVDFKKDTLYRICNLYPDEFKLPPFLPNGEFKLQWTLVNNNLQLAILNTYIKIFRPIKEVE